jgi:hypothetical protein
VVHGGNTKPVDGAGGPPEVPDAPPADKHDLIINKGDGGSDLVEITPLTGAPDAPVVHTMNPDSGVTPHPGSDAPPGGVPGDTGQPSFGSAAATASEAAPGGSGVSVVGSGGSGIQSVAPTAPDSGARAVDSFAAEYLSDAPAAPDLVISGLAADLGGDLAQVDEAVGGPPDLIDAPLEALEPIDDPDQSFDDLGS